MALKPRVDIGWTGWVEVARRTNNKGIVHLEDIWDHTKQQWKGIEEVRIQSNLSLNEMVLLLTLMLVLESLSSPHACPI